MLTEGQHGIHKDEVLMITGVLSINEKSVRDIMTEIDSVYMLSKYSPLTLPSLTIFYGFLFYIHWL